MSRKSGIYEVEHFGSTTARNSSNVAVIPSPPDYDDLSTVILTGRSFKDDEGFFVNQVPRHPHRSMGGHVHEGVKMTSVPLVHIGSYQVVFP